jgi:hypothetical protein
MKAAVLRAPGGLDRIEVHDIPDSGQPGPGQIRIALHATSLNYHDLLVANGTIPAADGRVLMSDGAGVVEAVGEGVAEFRPGDHVVSCFFPQWQDGLSRGPVGDLAPQAMASTASPRTFRYGRRRLSPTRHSVGATPRRQPLPPLASPPGGRLQGLMVGSRRQQRDYVAALAPAWPSVRRLALHPVARSVRQSTRYGPLRAPLLWIGQACRGHRPQRHDLRRGCGAPSPGMGEAGARPHGRRLGAGHRRCFHRRDADREDDAIVDHMVGGYRYLVV